MKKFNLLLSMVLVMCMLFQSTAFASTSFKDVGSNHWAKKEIDYLVDLKIITGYSNGTFKPNENVTNAQVAIMLARALNLDLSNRPNPNFLDVTRETSGYKEIAAVVDEGIFPKSVKFGPTQPASRATMARVLVNAFQLKGKNHVMFSDIKTTYWGYPYITALAANNITNGYSDGTFRPTENVTRAQFSVFMVRALNENFRPKPTVTRNIRFNMTVSQVESTETAPLNFRLKEGNLSALVYDINKYGYDSQLIYYFENGRLNFIAIDFLPYVLRYDTTSEMFQLQNSLAECVAGELGSSYYSDYDYDNGYLNIYSAWFKNFYTCFLNVNDEYVYTTAQLIYSPEVISSSEDSTSSATNVMKKFEKINSLKEEIVKKNED